MFGTPSRSMRLYVKCLALLLVTFFIGNVATAQTVMSYIGQRESFLANVRAPVYTATLDDIPFDTDISGCTFEGARFDPGNFPAPSAPLIVVRADETITTGEYDNSSNNDFNLPATSGKNVLSPGGEKLVPGPNPMRENDDLEVSFGFPVSAFGMDVLFQQLDASSRVSVLLLNRDSEVLMYVPEISTQAGELAVASGHIFVGFISSQRDIARVIINEYDSDNNNADCNIGFDTFVYDAPRPLSSAFNPQNGHWYSTNAGAKTWANAKRAAEQYYFKGFQGHLATFTSGSELSWALQTLDLEGCPTLWTGGHQTPKGAEPAGGWSWVTGETWDYSYWGADQPDNNAAALGEEDSIEFYTRGGQWNDRNELDELGFLIEFGPSSPPSFSPSTVDYSVQFDGNDFIYIPPSLQLDLKKNLTMSAWVKTESSAHQQVIWRGDLRGGQDPYHLTIIDGKMRFGVDFEQWLVYRTYALDNIDDNYHYWTGVYDSAGKNIMLYRNGRLESSTAVSGDYNYQTDTLWYMIGSLDTGTWGMFTGLIDDVSIWNDIRSPAQIRNDMAATFNGSERGLVAYYNFDEGDGQIAHNIVPGSPDGRLGSNAGHDSSDPAWIKSNHPLMKKSSVRNWNVYR